MKWFNLALDALIVMYLATLIIVNAAHTSGSVALQLMADTIALAFICWHYYNRGRESATK